MPEAHLLYVRRTRTSLGRTVLSPRAPQVAIAVVNTSNRLARGKMTEDKVDRRHGIWVMAEGTRLATSP